MFEESTRKLWRLKELLLSFCLGHNGCKFCPLFSVKDNCCRVKQETGRIPEDLDELFPEDYAEKEGH